MLRHILIKRTWVMAVWVAVVLPLYLALHDNPTAADLLYDLIALGAATDYFEKWRQSRKWRVS